MISVRTTLSDEYTHCRTAAMKTADIQCKMVTHRNVSGVKNTGVKMLNQPTGTEVTNSCVLYMSVLVPCFCSTTITTTYRFYSWINSVKDKRCRHTALLKLSLATTLHTATNTTKCTLSFTSIML